jgi:hydroxymethylpyrimidine pyrophosphatase-like HAD family hydrolase
MDYQALACDYDGTIAREGAVEASTEEALRLVREAGLKLVLVTGRILEELQRVFPRLELFHRVVAEDGGLLYRPETGEAQPLGAAPPPGFRERLRRLGVEPIQAGQVVVATREPHGNTVLDLIREMKIDYRVSRNKGAVMVLPVGVDKGSGLLRALRELAVSPSGVVAVGDGENDRSLLAVGGCGVAVANGVPELKRQADLVTAGSHGRGVEEVVSRLLHGELPERLR